MNNKEYQDVHKKERKAFKKYRKHMWKVIISFLIAIAAFTIIPSALVPLHGLLNSLFSTYIADSIYVWIEVLIFAGGSLSGVINAIKAYNSKEDVEKYQDEEEDIVEGIKNEYDKLLNKVETLEKSKTKEENKASIKSNNYTKHNNSSYFEIEKEKKYTK